MKPIQRLLIALLIFVVVTTPVSAGCLNDYNNALRICDQYFCPNGIGTCMGCYGDAVGDYYGCVLHAAVN